MIVLFLCVRYPHGHRGREFLATLSARTYWGFFPILDVTRADLVSVEVLFSQEQTALGDYRSLLRPKVTGSKAYKGVEKAKEKANTVKIITEQ